MADNRISVKISVVGNDGKEHKIDWYVNWQRDTPAKIFDAVVDLGQKLHLETNEWV